MKLVTSYVGRVVFACVLALGAVGCGDDSSNRSGAKGGSSAKSSSSGKGGSGGSSSSVGGSSGSKSSSGGSSSVGGSSAAGSSAMGGSSAGGSTTGTGGTGGNATGGSSGTGTGGATGTAGSTGTGGAGGTTGTVVDAGANDAGIDAPTTDGSVLEDDGGASEVGADAGTVSGPEVGPDAPVDSPVDAWVGEVGDALSTDGDFENCYLAIKNNGYAAQGAEPCSSCMENQFSRETECKAKLDCLAAAGAECVSGTNCYTDCMNSGGGGTPAATCAANLITAACQ